MTLIRSKKKIRRRRRRRPGLRRIHIEPLSEDQIRKGIRRMLSPSFLVSCYYRGLDPALDRKIEKLAPATYHESVSRETLAAAPWEKTAEIASYPAGSE